MEITKTTSFVANIAHSEKSESKSLFWEQMEFIRFGLVPAILTVVVCISAIAGAFAAEIGTLQLSIVGIPTAIFIATIIAVAPMRAIFSLAALSLFVDILMFMFH